MTVASLTACSPALDWREFVPEGSGGLAVAFPCRPDQLERRVTLGEAAVDMHMLVCSAGDATFAIAYVDVTDPARVGTTLQAWRASAIENVRGMSPISLPLKIQGMTPNAHSGRFAWTGQRPGGAPLREQAAFFAHGLRVFQATVIGAEPPAAANEVFFGALRFPG